MLLTIPTTFVLEGIPSHANSYTHIEHNMICHQVHQYDKTIALHQIHARKEKSTFIHSAASG